MARARAADRPGLAGPSMLADTIVRRWQDHQPLTRLEDIYRREQLDLAKSTLCNRCIKPIWRQARRCLTRRHAQEVHG
ncbi:MAG TPA: transposase [Polyangiaceae bacterium]|nr:transposase [Polyangiaceae bacterium]